jgi:transketolase
VSIRVIPRLHQQRDWPAVGCCINGHDLAAVTGALDQIEPAGRGAPHVLIADTIKGKGVSRMERDLDWHVGNLGADDYQAVVTELLAGRPAPAGSLR